jgi:hypothetical protein
LKRGSVSLCAVLYAAKCYWPEVTAAELEQIAARALRARSQTVDDRAKYLGSLLFAADDLVLCLFEGPTRAAVSHDVERLRIPSERLMDAIWLGLNQRAIPGGGT